MDTTKLQTLGVPVTDAYKTLQTFLGGLYVNDFNEFGHTWQVIVQAEPEFRAKPSDIDRFYVRSSGGQMVPLGTLASVTPTTGPDVVYRYNRFRAIQILGGPAPGYSSGEAVAAMEQVAASTLPPGFSLRMDRHHLSAESWRRATKALFSASPRFWCFCSWRRSMKAGRFRLPLYSQCRWECSAL